jgi:hypothetical protein
MSSYHYDPGTLQTAALPNREEILVKSNFGPHFCRFDPLIALTLPGTLLIFSGAIKIHNIAVAINDNNVQPLHRCIFVC